MVNLYLHGFIALRVRDMASDLRMASTSMGGMNAALSIPPAFKVEKVILSLGPRGLLLMGA